MVQTRAVLVEQMHVGQIERQSDGLILLNVRTARDPNVDRLQARYIDIRETVAAEVFGDTDRARDQRVGRIHHLDMFGTNAK